MPSYVINKNQQSNGDYEIHSVASDCIFMPNPENRIDLGFHNSCHDALSTAKNRWSNKKINGCYYCCNACNTD